MGSMMAWDPLREPMSLREAMDRLFEESFLRPERLSGSEGPTPAAPIDVYETKENVVLKAAVPGVKLEDLDVSITGDVLTIKGEYKNEEQKQEGRNYIRQERRYGSFCRQLTLPAAIDADKVNASFEDGVLTLELPKREDIKAKSVKITAKK